MRFVVAGGTGLVGRLVVAAAESGGHDAIAISRRSGVDLTTGHGLDELVRGADAVIDVTNAPGISRRASMSFFESVTANLLAAEASSEVPHHVALSIVGIDRVASGYYQGKLRQEELIEAGEVPWTILRATQFHEFAGQLLERAIGPLAPVPRMRSATVAAREVAEALVRWAAAGPQERTPDLGGPEVHELPDLARRVLAARGRRAWVLPLRMPGAAGRAMREGGLLPVGPATVGRQTFAAWLAETTAP